MRLSGSKKYLFLMLLLPTILFGCRQVRIANKPKVIVPVEEANTVGSKADVDYMKRFFSNKSEWIGTTPGKNMGENVGKFVTKEWETSEKSESFNVLPKDTFNQFSDWVYAASEKYINPRGYIDQPEKDQEPLDLDVLMETSVEHRANVLFPHDVHTFWLKCDNCHPSIFIPKNNANPINMMKVINGEFCGVCHGKVAFPITQCDRCHSSPK